jgi:polar amino acid transport system permease protein
MTTIQTQATTEFPTNTIVPLPRPGRMIASIVLAVLIGCLLTSFVTNPRYSWPVVGKYLFSEPILKGLSLTLALTAISITLGSLGGFLLAQMRLSPSLLFRVTSGVYIWFFRGTPLLVLLIILYNISYLYPNVTIGVPFFGPTLATVNVNAIITPTAAAIVAFSLNEAAFMCEVFRGGLLSVGKGQSEAAQALGMRKSQVTIRIVVPQAMNFVLPPLGNQVISLLKATSLVSVVSSADLLYSAQAIYADTYQTVPLLFVTAIWYLVLTSLLSVVQKAIERNYGRGSRSVSYTADAVTGGWLRGGLRWLHR